MPLFHIFKDIATTKDSVGEEFEVWRDCWQNWLYSTSYGIVIALVSSFRDLHRLSSDMVTYIWVGLVFVGTILLFVFVIDFMSRDRNL